MAAAEKGSLAMISTQDAQEDSTEMSTTNSVQTDESPEIDVHFVEEVINYLEKYPPHDSNILELCLDNLRRLGMLKHLFVAVPKLD